MTSRSASILLVDDEAMIRSTLGALLRRHGYQVTTAADGTEALSLLYRHTFDLLILDLKLPGLSGIELARRAHVAQPTAGILLFTGAGSLDTAIDGLRLHVLDYVLKSESPQDVLARIEQALESHEQQRLHQRLLQQLQQVVQQLDGQAAPESAPPSDPPSMVVGDLELSAWDHLVRIGERRIDLTLLEFRILAYLAQHVGQVQTPAQIVKQVYGYEIGALEATDMIKPHISHLRRKIEDDPAAPRYLLTVRGAGYMLVGDTRQQSDDEQVAVPLHSLALGAARHAEEVGGGAAYQGERHMPSLRRDLATRSE